MVGGRVSCPNPRSHPLSVVDFSVLDLLFSGFRLRDMIDHMKELRKLLSSSLLSSADWEFLFTTSCGVFYFSGGSSFII